MASPKNIRGWLDRDDILILDTETTGFSGSAEIIEIVMMDTTGLVHLSELSMPVDGIPKATSDVHGLTIDELLWQNAVDWPAIHDLVASVLDDAQSRHCVERQFRPTYARPDRHSAPEATSGHPVGSDMLPHLPRTAPGRSTSARRCSRARRRHGRGRASCRGRLPSRAGSDEGGGG